MNRRAVGITAIMATIVATGQVVSMASDRDRERQPIELTPASETTGAVETATAGGDIGPDVIVGSLTGTSTNGSLGGPRYWGTSGGMRAYSVGTTSCNLGDQNLDWFDFGTPNPTKHPVIAQNLYRLHEGKFEQIGLSWLKHGFCALQGGLCTSCNAACGGCCDELGPGCSDPYGASLNGSQSGLGPRSQIDPTAGAIEVWPFTPSGGGTLTGRIQVAIGDLENFPGATYFVEGHYIAEDDAKWGNANNNASWREVTVSGNALPYSGGTHQEEAAIMAWKAADPLVEIVNVDVPVGEGRFHLGYRVTDNGDGTWHYEYALHNLNVRHAAGAFEVAMGDASISNIEFNQVPHHSGEPYATDDWTVTEGGSNVRWATDSFNADSNANALRWGTMFNFRFDSNAAPVAGDITIDLHAPPAAGEPSDVTVNVMVPGNGPINECAADTDGSGSVDVDDLINVILDWASDGSGNGGDVTGDGFVDVDDLVQVILEFGACP